MRSLVLLLVSTFCLAKFVKSYGVSEHRVDFIKTVNGHEYNYHYHDGSAPRFEKHIKRSHRQPTPAAPLPIFQHPALVLPQQSKQPQLLVKPVATNRPSPYKQPYHSKFFLSSANHEQIYANEFDALPGGNGIYSSSDNKLHSIHGNQPKNPMRAIVVPDDDDDDDYEDEDETPVRRPEVRLGSPKTNTGFYSTPNSLQNLQIGHKFQHVKIPVQTHQNIKSVSGSDESNYVPRAGSFFSNVSNPATLPGFHYIAGGFSYYNRHLSPKKEKPSETSSYVTPDFLTTRKPFTTTESYQRPDFLKVYKPYVTPDFLTTRKPTIPTLFPTTARPPTSPTSPATPAPPSKYFIQQRPTKHPVPPPRPYLAPELTTTVRSYVAPTILQEQKQQLKLHEQALNAQRTRPQSGDALSRVTAANGASRFRYLAPASESTPVAQKQSELYEPEFDIDIRIDLSSDAA
ncbi:uncharacterized protein LOC129739898 [Uranotaenia lowii]|uniref:uncharacterized protein LOC129739898 n=1 Tax=Uranotaenia lowii TaxID=190385 RepID=UPI0024789D5A|nr:uncharacterized protein LOC129739898 [Uranotaenia lowii]